MTQPSERVEGGVGERDFAHASEAELARILDFYAVRWEYEPRTFPILWNLEGAVVESFAPDFYLPDLDLYLEMTTLRQKLVRKKNRKLRRLRELYPDIRIKLFYARDFRALMLKYGKLALINELSGTPGQVAGPRDVLVVGADIVIEPLAGALELGLLPAPLGADEPAADEPAAEERAADAPSSPEVAALAAPAPGVPAVPPRGRPRSRRRPRPAPRATDSPRHPSRRDLPGGGR